MATTIGGVTLDNDMIFDDEFKWRQLDVAVFDTIGGGRVVQEFEKSETGRAITLKTVNGQGYQTKAVVSALTALTSSPEKTYSLSISHNSLTFSRTVRFKNETDGGAVQFSMCYLLDGLQKTDFWYEGTIYLEVV